jgi:hypothetical protein
MKPLLLGIGCNVPNFHVASLILVNMTSILLNNSSTKIEYRGLDSSSDLTGSEFKFK